MKVSIVIKALEKVRLKGLDRDQPGVLQFLDRLIFKDQRIPEQVSIQKQLRVGVHLQVQAVVEHQVQERQHQADPQVQVLLEAGVVCQVGEKVLNLKENRALAECHEVEVAIVTLVRVIA